MSQAGCLLSSASSGKESCHVCYGVRFSLGSGPGPTVGGAREAKNPDGEARQSEKTHYPDLLKWWLGGLIRAGQVLASH